MTLRQKIAVTGSSGQLGNAIRQYASFLPQFEFILLSKEELSIEDPLALELFFSKHSPQYFINCAAYTAVDKAEEDEKLAFAINADAVKDIARLCHEYNCRLIHISTDYVFDGTTNIPYRESSPAHPVNVYGASKLAGENYASNICAEAIIIRTSWLYSATGKNFVKTMVRLMKEKQQLNIVNDQFGSPTYAPDLADAILKIIDSGNWLPGIYHFSNQGMISWYEFALAIKELTGNTCRILPISTTDYPTAAKRPRFSVLDTEKIQSVYGIELKSWKESLGLCLLYFNGI